MDIELNKPQESDARTGFILPTWWERGYGQFFFLTACFFLEIRNLSNLNATTGLDAPPTPDDSAESFAATAGHGSLGRQIAFALIALYGLLGYRDLAHSRLLRRNSAAAVPIILLGWMLISLSWSESPSASAARLFGIVALLLAGLRLRLRFTSQQILRWITITTLCFMCAGFIYEVASGTFHPLLGNYRFYGSLSPNEQGVNCSIAVLGCFWVARQGQRPGVWIAWMSTAFAFDLLTKSRTALSAVFLTLLVAVLVCLNDWRKRVLFLLAAISLATGLIVLQNAQVLSLSNSTNMGRDSDLSDTSSLTGRMPLWTELMKSVRDHPIVGVGFGGFWTPERILQISDDQGWGISGSHNSYIEILLTLGIVGLMLYSATLLVALCLSAQEFSLTRHGPSAFFGCILLFSVIDGIADAEPVNVSAFLCFCFIVSVIHIFSRKVALDPARRLGAGYLPQPVRRRTPTPA